MRENKLIVANINTFSHYSILSSCLSIDDIVDCAIKNNNQYVCLTDDNLYGAIEFYKKAKKHNLKPVIGLTIDYQNSKIVIIAYNYDGYKNLIKISSNISRNISFDLNQFISNTFIINMSDNEIALENALIYSYNQLNENRIAVNESRYKTIDDKKILNAMNAILSNVVLESVSDLELGKDLSLLSNDQFINLFDDVSIENLFKEIEKVDLIIPFGENNLIKYPINENISSKVYLKRLCNDGLNKKIEQREIDINKRKIYEERLDYELSIIDSMGFNDYFLIVQDFIAEAKNRDILVGPGRGSAASSLVAYLLGITDVDSIKYDLLFERFLNPGRVSMPDIDIDIMDSRRNEVINYIFDKYGYDRVAHIITFQRIKSKMAIRDVARIMNIDLKIVNAICKLIPLEYDDDLDAAIDKVSKLKQYKNDFNDLFEISSKLIGAPRQTGVHAAGIVLSNSKLDDIIPIQLTVNNEISTQFSMDFLEELGLLKMDLLGLTNLTTLYKIKTLIASLKKIHIDFNKIDLNDQKVFNYLSKGNTIGIFQLESPGMTNLIKKMKPKSIEDISLCSAMFRPGPQQNIPSFLARRNKEEPIDYIHKSIAHILEPTNGIIVYQEQVINIVKTVGDFSASEADIFRRIISKKYGNELDDFKAKFKERALKNGYTENDFDVIYNYIYTFANYGFNHAHSISYALLGYWLTYLKYYYPLEFMTILMSSSEGNTSKIIPYINECKKLNIEVINPSINMSNAHFSLSSNNKIIMGFNSIKSIGNEISKKIINARQLKKNKKFIDYIDCIITLTKNKIGKSTIETLIYAGVLDCFDKTRTFLLKNLDEIILVSKHATDNNLLFEPNIIDVEENDDDKKMLHEKFVDLLGIDFSEIEKNDYPKFNNEQKDIISKYNLTQLNYQPLDTNFYSLVKLVKIKKTQTKTGKEMAFFTFIDNANQKIDAASFAKNVINDESFHIDKWYIIEFKPNARGNQIVNIKEKL